MNGLNSASMCYKDALKIQISTSVRSSVKIGEYTLTMQ